MSHPGSPTASTSDTNEHNEVASSIQEHLIEEAVQDTRLRRALRHQVAEEGDDIIKHLLELERKYQYLKTIWPKHKLDAYMPEEQFIMLVSLFLPPSWDEFINTLTDYDRKHIKTQDFINECIAEYEKRQAQTREDIA